MPTRPAQRGPLSDSGGQQAGVTGLLRDHIPGETDYPPATIQRAVSAAPEFRIDDLLRKHFIDGDCYDLKPAVGHMKLVTFGHALNSPRSYRDNRPWTVPPSLFRNEKNRAIPSVSSRMGTRMAWTAFVVLAKTMNAQGTLVAVWQT